jgi:Divalent cation transporter
LISVGHAEPLADFEPQNSAVFHCIFLGGQRHLIACTVGAALVGIVTFGSLVGSMLPFILKRIGFDPASASAPFVATLVDDQGDNLGSPCAEHTILRDYQNVERAIFVRISQVGHELALANEVVSAQSHEIFPV